MIDHSLFLLVPVLISMAVNVVMHIFAWTYFKQYSKRYPLSEWRPTVSIIIPLRGVDEFADENFKCVFEQNYQNNFEVIFAVEDMNDRVVPIVKRIMAEYKYVRSRLIISNSKNIKAFGKSKNLIAGYMESIYEVIIFIDSDIRVQPTFLTNTVGSIEDPEVGLAFAPPVCKGADNWIAALQNFAINFTAMIFASGAYTNRLYAVTGWIMAMRREVIEQIGILEKIRRRVIGIDLTIGKAVRDSGLRIHLLNEPALSINKYKNFKQYWSQMHRWLVTTNLYYPAIPILIFIGGFPVLWSGMYIGIEIVMGNYPIVGLIMLPLVLIMETTAVIIINLKLAKDRTIWRFIWTISIGEIIGLPLFIHSLISSNILWRGRRMKIKRDLTAKVIDESTIE